MDFDDLLCMTLQLFEAFPDVLEKYRNRFQYVLVDDTRIPTCPNIS